MTKQINVLPLATTEKALQSLHHDTNWSKQTLFMCTDSGYTSSANVSVPAARPRPELRPARKRLSTKMSLARLY